MRTARRSTDQPPRRDRPVSGALSRGPRPHPSFAGAPSRCVAGAVATGCRQRRPSASPQVHDHPRAPSRTSTPPRPAGARDERLTRRAGTAAHGSASPGGCKRCYDLADRRVLGGEVGLACLVFSSTAAASLQVASARPSAAAARTFCPTMMISESPLLNAVEAHPMAPTTTVILSLNPALKRPLGRRLFAPPRAGAGRTRRLRHAREGTRGMIDDCCSARRCE